MGDDKPRGVFVPERIARLIRGTQGIQVSALPPELKTRALDALKRRGALRGPVNGRHDTSGRLLCGCPETDDAGESNLEVLDDGAGGIVEVCKLCR